MNGENDTADAVEEAVLNALWEEPHEVLFRAEDDWINAYVYLREHSPLWVMVGTDYRLDDRRIRHAAQPGEPEDIVLREGEITTRSVMVDDVYSSNGPGAEQLTIDFVTE